MAKEHVLLNACVFNHFCGLVDVKTLKVCRSVCKRWNILAGLHLRKRTWVPGEGIHVFDRPSDVSMKMLKNIKLGNDFREAVSVLTEYRSSIELLEILAFDSLLAEALIALPSLEHLSILSASTDLKIPDWNRKPFEGKAFETLKSCQLVNRYADDRKVSSKHGLQDFYVSLLKSCEKTLTTLKIVAFSDYGYTEILTNVNLKRLHKFVINEAKSPIPSTQLQLLKTSLRTNCSNLAIFKCCLPRESRGQDATDILMCLANARVLKLIFWMYPTYELRVPKIPAIMPNMIKLTVKQVLGVEAATLASCLPKVRWLSIILPSHGSKGWKRMKHLNTFFLRVDPGDTLSYHRGLTHANFPSLTKLTTTLSAGSGRTIFASLRNLTELKIEENSSICDEDITGIESEKLLPLRKNPTVEVVRTQAYIGDLKSLKVLWLKSSAITEASLKYGVSHLESLTHLTIQHPAARVTKIIYNENEEAGDNELGQGDNRRLGSIVREVWLRRLNPIWFCLDMESLLLPRVPNLMHLTVLINSQFNTIYPINPVLPIRMTYQKPEFQYVQLSKAIRPQFRENEFFFEQEVEF